MSISRHTGRRWARGGFVPSHCPNEKCPFYIPHPDWHYRKTGWYLRPSDGKRFPSFQCYDCGRYFSTRTFSPTYWLRYRELFPRIAALSVNAPALRQIGRIFDISHATVGRHLARAGRHCLVLHAELTRSMPIQESLVVDGFETFEYSQFFPCHYNLAVGDESWFIYNFTDSPLRRKGTMTEAQKRKRLELETELGCPDPKAVEKGVADLLRPLLPRLPMRPAGVSEQPLIRDEASMTFSTNPPDSVRTLFLWTDEHKAYLRSLQQLRESNRDLEIVHRTVSSKVRRTTSNRLFPVNLTDLLIRHSKANHKRETIAFNKRRQRGLERMAVFVVWRNLIKRRREKEAGRTAATEAGLTTEPWLWPRVFRGRRFVRRERLPDRWWEYYWGRVKTAALGERQSEHTLRFAF